MPSKPRVSEAPLGIQVQCYAGYRGEQEPRRFSLGTNPVEVAAILDRWLAPDHRYFKVRGDDGGIYILRHDEQFNRWEMTLYDGGSGLAQTLEVRSKHDR